MNPTAAPTSRVGVDVGGTFTDLVHLDGTQLRVAKVPSTPTDQAQGIVASLERAGVDPAELSRFVHGTTVATNTVLERDGARTVLVTTAGFADLLAIARQDRPHLYRLDSRRPTPLVPRERVVEAEERVAADGTVLAPLSDAEVARVTAAVAALEPDAVAISLLFGFLHPVHEERLAAALHALEVPLTRSSELLPVLREVERTSTVVLNAYLAPRMARYLDGLADRLGAAGLQPAVEVMRSGGGTATAEVAAREPVRAVLSGPAAGAWGAAALGRACGAEDVIAFDVGGTSTDVTLVTAGRPRTTADGMIGGLPFAVTTTDIHTIGAGGGSLAWRDDGGALRVGPRSAGADPGPACYGQGGTRPTVTDANVVLGRLDAGVRLGGTLPLRADLAHRAVSGLAEEFGLDARDCAEGIIAVTDAAMAAALRVVSIERGHDPRDFALLPFGGAGALHQAALAAELGCRRVLVPPNPGVLSALGLLAAPVTVDRVQAQLGELATMDAATLETTWRDLEDQARRSLATQDSEVATVTRSADLRYRGQAFELSVPGTAEVVDLAERFHAAHAERYGYRQPEATVEVIALRVRAEGPTPELPLPPVPSATAFSARPAAGPAAASPTGAAAGSGLAAAQLGTREVIDDRGPVTAALLDRSRLGAGATLRGPAIVVGVDATVWVAPWQRGEVDDRGVLLLEEAP